MAAIKLILFVVLGLFAIDSEAGTSFLRNFNINTNAAMNSQPKKWGTPQDSGKLQEKIDACRQTDSRDFIMRAARSSAPRAFNSPIFSGDYPDNSARQFLEVETVIDNIASLDSALREGRTDIKPWSSDYWAIRTGVTAKRYLDENFPGSTTMNTWQEAFDYFKLNPPQKADPNILSPSEKYDVLVGDDNFTLTNTSWEEGKAYNDQFGEVEKWMGICHGWAPASYMEPRPDHTLKIKSYKIGSEQIIEFRPDDLKALASVKWAYGVNVTADYQSGATRFIGGRCNVKDPAKDPETGRIIDSDCFDLNPGLWHVVITNQIGQGKRPLVIDASFDYEVWNQPVVSYKYSYFNPKTLQYVAKLQDARVRLDDPDFKDKFIKFRNNKSATELVGVTMDVEYVVETSPDGALTDSAENDRTRFAKYHYDLELDETGRIVGGEWYQNKHPDFVWSPMKDSVAVNQEDLYNFTDELVPKIAPTASKSGVPLRYVLNKLLDNFR